RRASADVEKEGALRLQHTRRRRHPAAGPLQIVGLAQTVLVLVVANPEVIRRRRDDDVDAARLHLPENVQAIIEIEGRLGAARPSDSFVGFPKSDHRCLSFRQATVSTLWGSGK